MTTFAERVQKHSHHHTQRVRKDDARYVQYSQFNFQDEYNKKIVDLAANDLELFAQKLKEEDLRKALLAKTIKERWPISKTELEKRVEEYAREVHGFGIADPLMKTDGITDIRFARNETTYWFNGVEYEYHHSFKNNDEILRWVENKLRFTPFSYNRSDGRLDAYLIDGSRIHVKGETTGRSWFEIIDGKMNYHFEESVIVTIRRFGGFKSLKQLFSLDEAENVFDKKKGIGPKWAYAFVKLAAGIGLTHIIIGNTGSGKTTFANAEVEHAVELIVPKQKAIPHEIAHLAKKPLFSADMLLVEEAPESQPFFKGKVYRSWDRLANQEGKGLINMGTNLKDALRQFIQVIFVGEMRTPEICGMFREAKEMGCKLALSTYHSPSTKMGLSRYERQLSVAPGSGDSREIARHDTARTIELLYYLERVGSRIRLKEIKEVIGLTATDEYITHDVAVWNPTGLNDEGLADGVLLFNGVSERTKRLCENYGVGEKIQEIEELAKEEGFIYAN